MDLIEKYIYAIGQKLPMKGRNEIKMELKSLLLDEIEEKYGKNPSKDELESSILAFGTPAEIAKKYNSHSHIINPNFYELFFLLLKIIGGALTIAFTTIFIVSLFTEPHTGKEVLNGIAVIPLRTIQAFLSATGSVTLVFILITRFAKDEELNIESDWSIKELEAIELSPETESRIESIVVIFLIPIFLTLIIVYPELIQFLENSFEKSTIMLGHKVNIDMFRAVLPLFVIEGFITIIYHIILLKKGIRTRGLKILDITNSMVNILIAVILLNINNLFIYTGGVNQGIFTRSTFGFKLIILISLIIGIIELIGKIVRHIKNSLLS